MEGRARVLRVGGGAGHAGDDRGEHGARRAPSPDEGTIGVGGGENRWARARLPDHDGRR